MLVRIFVAILFTLIPSIAFGQCSGNFPANTLCGTATGGVPHAVAAPLSVSNSDSSLTISPTTGSVIASLNVAHANSFSATQTFSNVIDANLVSGGTQCVQATAAGLLVGKRATAHWRFGREFGQTLSPGQSRIRATLGQSWEHLHSPPASPRASILRSAGWKKIAAVPSCTKPRGSSCSSGAAPLDSPSSASRSPPRLRRCVCSRSFSSGSPRTCSDDFRSKI